MPKEYHLLEITYIHPHECYFKGQAFIDRPVCSNGVAMIVKPICIETGTELQEVERRAY